MADLAGHPEATDYDFTACVTCGLGILRHKDGVGWWHANDRIPHDHPPAPVEAPEHWLDTAIDLLQPIVVLTPGQNRIWDVWRLLLRARNPGSAPVG